MKISVLFVVLIIRLNSVSYAQDLSRWSVSLSYGIASPIAGFQKAAPEKTVVYDPYTPGVAFYNGFDKQGNSAAKAGTFFSLGLNYLITKKWIVFLDFGNTTNSVNVESVMDYWKVIYGPVANTVQNDYQTMFALTGIGYKLKWKKLDLMITQKIGWAIMQFPDYRFGGWINERPEAPLQSFMVGWGIKASYFLNKNIFTGIAVSFTTADFNYSVALRVVPGGSTIISKSDQVSYRQLTTGIHVGYRF